MMLGRSGFRAMMLRLVPAFGLAGLPTESAQAVFATCDVSTTGVGFGTYDVFSATATDAAGDIGVSCTGLALSLLVSYDILISTGGSGVYASRTMVSGSDQLAYNLYADAARTTIWGDGSSGTGVASDGYTLGLFTVTRHYPVYGRIPALQNAAVGSYSDTLIVTVNYN